MKARVIMVASCKGGVGKTTVTANLALSLAKLGRRTLMVDCDFGMRCLDLVCGLSDKVTYDVCDCILRGISPERAAVRDPRSPSLWFIAGPYRYGGGIDGEGFRSFLETASEELSLDYIIVDTHGGEGVEFSLAAPNADIALVVSTHQEASIRAAEETAKRISELGSAETRLIINSYDVKAARRGRLPGVLELIDRTRVRLIGIIPRDDSMLERQVTGSLAASDGRSRSGKAFANVARRLDGESVPLSVE